MQERWQGAGLQCHQTRITFCVGSEMRAIFPGTFDPLTVGHMNVIERTAKIFTEVVVSISTSRRRTWLAGETRLQLAQESCKHLKNVQCELFHGMTTDFAKEKSAKVVVRGLRTITDYETEKTMMAMNKHLSPELITVMLMTEPHLSHVSSTLTKEIISVGGDTTALVPTAVSAYIKTCTPPV